jgi:HPt (histidine-containing phosphotransfer) domain-containing protein
MIDLCCHGDGPRLLGDLAAALAGGDCAGVEHAAHALKGLVAEFHAPAAQAAARALEQAAREQQPIASLRETAALLENEFQRLTAALASFVRSR